MTDAKEAKPAQTEDHQPWYHLVLADTSAFQCTVLHFTFKMLTQCSKDAKHPLTQSVQKTLNLLSSEIQMIKKKIQDEQVSKCIVFCA